MPQADCQNCDPLTWLDQYGNAMYQFAKARVRDSFAAEDLVQETLLAAYRSRKSFLGQSSLKTWLTGILKHKIIDYYRKLSPEQCDANIDQFAESLNDLFDENDKWQVKPGNWHSDPENIYQSTELLTIIHACLDEMPSKMAKAYAMREMEGLATSEICELFQTGENNCWVILCRARMSLRRCLEIKWFGGEK